jgi:hypothetical protein
VSSLIRHNRRWKDDPVRAAVAVAGGIETIVAAMRNHDADAGVWRCLSLPGHATS